MIQQQKEQPKPPAHTFRATRELCIAEGFWNLCFVAVQSSVLPYLPQMYGRVLSPSLTWLACLTVLIFGGFIVYKIALAARWFWRIKYLTQPVYVEPTHWQDQFPFTRKRLVLRTLAVVLTTLIALGALFGQVFSPMLLGYYLAVPCMIVSVIAGWKHFRKR
ncbi:hypothetical protein [Armatimonas sp.]|uniref:hypothetical protein n=1 Tax=Armatimonas sp. TaxID=1872638 RepID=UPI00286C164F|nr:hypothetical protein [Armatimonas sp.]